MSSHNLDVYMPIIILMSFGVVAFLGAIWIVSKLLRPSNPNSLKEQPYECGETPIGTAWSNFNVRFYVVSLVFIIFDVEGALMFPVAAVFKKFNEIGEGGAILASICLFIGILAAGMVYCWKKGDLDWVKSFNLSEDQINQMDEVKEA